MQRSDRHFQTHQPDDPEYLSCYNNSAPGSWRSRLYTICSSKLCQSHLLGAFKPRIHHLLQLILVFLVASLMGACQSTSTQPVTLSIPVIVDGRQVTITT